MTIVGLLALVGASSAVALSWIAREIACGEAGGDCGPGLPVLTVAVAGLVPVLGAIGASRREHGHPWRWLLAAAFVYAIWAIGFAGWVS